MDALIYDAISVFTQILMGFAPDYLGDATFLLAGYIFACAFILIVLASFLKILTAFSRVVLLWMSGGR